MHIGFGAHRDLSPEMVVLNEPSYVEWMLNQDHANGPLANLRETCRLLVGRFDARPFVAPCSHRGCPNRAELGAAHAGRLHVEWWCDKCYPFDRWDPDAYPGRVITYADALRHGKDCHRDPGEGMRLLVRALAEAKGLPTPLTEEAARAFFRQQEPPQETPQPTETPA